MNVTLTTHDGEQVVIAIDDENKTAKVIEAPDVPLFQELLDRAARHTSTGDGFWPDSVLHVFAERYGMTIASELPEREPGPEGRIY